MKQKEQKDLVEFFKKELAEAKENMKEAFDEDAKDRFWYWSGVVEELHQFIYKFDFLKEVRH